MSKKHLKDSFSCQEGVENRRPKPPRDPISKGFQKSPRQKLPSHLDHGLRLIEYTFADCQSLTQGQEMQEPRHGIPRGSAPYWHLGPQRLRSNGDQLASKDASAEMAQHLGGQNFQPLGDQVLVHFGRLLLTHAWRPLASQHWQPTVTNCWLLKPRSAARSASTQTPGAHQFRCHAQHKHETRNTQLGCFAGTRRGDQETRGAGA